MTRRTHFESLNRIALIVATLIMALSFVKISYATIDDEHRWKPDEKDFYVENLVSRGVSHNKAILSWDKNDRADGYIVYYPGRLWLKGSSNYEVYYYMSEKERITDADITSVTFQGTDVLDDMGNNSILTVVPYYYNNNQIVEGNAKYAVKVQPLDYNKEKYQNDNTTPIINNIELLSSGKLTDTCAIRMKVDIDGTGSKIKELKTQPYQTCRSYRREDETENWYIPGGAEGEAKFTWTSNKKEEKLQRELAMIPVENEDGDGVWCLGGPNSINRIKWIEVTDQGGNTAYWMSDVASTNFYYEKEFDVTFEGVLSHPLIAEEISSMDAGQTVALTVDESSKGILKKELLDAIAGQDKTLVIYLNNKHTMEWVINGRNITGDTKDIDLNVKLSIIDGEKYNTTGKLIQLVFAENGVLPGQIDFRLKSAYLSTYYDAEATFLYYKNGNVLELEDANCEIISDGSDIFCNFNINHNSTFILSSKKLTNPLKDKTLSLSKTKFAYDGEAHSPDVTVKKGKVELRNGVDYTVTQKEAVDVGTYTVTVKGAGNYSGKLTAKFKIVPQGTSLETLSGAKNAFTVKWIKQPEMMSTSRITGYQIQYSTSKTFKSGNKTVKVKGYNKASKKISKLKSKKRYYVRVRTYKTISKTTYYSAWSEKMSIKTK